MRYTSLSLYAAHRLSRLTRLNWDYKHYAVEFSTGPRRLTKPNLFLSTLGAICFAGIEYTKYKDKSTQVGIKCVINTRRKYNKKQKPPPNCNK